MSFDFSEPLNGLINIALLLLILVVLVVIHEFGHFIVARRAGVKVHEFGIGFPPKAKTLGTDKHGTEYTLNWLPIGGFVRLEGEEGESDDPNSFVRQRLGTRLTILLAGVVMNFLLAFVIFTLVAAVADPVSNARIAYVQPGSPAESAGLRGGERIGTTPRGAPIYDDSGDLITAVNGQRFPVFDHIGIGPGDSPHGQYLRAHAGQTVVVSVRHANGTERDLTVTLRDPGDAAQGALGVSFNSLTTEDIRHDPVTAVAKGAQRTLDASTLILRGVAGLISNLASPPVAGPIGIGDTIGDLRTQLPPVFMIWFIGMLSANLAVVNALPFPPLDGGRVAVSLIQAVTNNRISEGAERLAYLTGFILLMMLIGWVTLFDLGILQRT